MKNKLLILSVLLGLSLITGCNKQPQIQDYNEIYNVENIQTEKQETSSVTENKDDILSEFSLKDIPEYNDIIDGNYLYNRCHLIGYQLAGENANKKNLITGTRYLNVVGMLPFENNIDDYVDSSNNHVLYRVTPIFEGNNFEGNNLVASGVLMEAWSVEDNGKLHFCVYCYNVQPGIGIDYATGESWEDASVVATDNKDVFFSEEAENTVTEDNITYILNTSSKKIHLENCSTISKMSENNKEESNESKEELINKGYEPCKVCNP